MTNTGSISETDLQGLSQLEILIKLYEGAIGFLQTAVEAMQKEQESVAKPLIERTRRIIQEFKRTLDHENGGELARQLDDLYDFMLDNLDKGELTGDTAPLSHVVQLLNTLLDGWRNAVPKEG
ncbi:MAG: flagellar export chaperone FliS [Magnetococcales bacterium]|nr:flagellar export chaperone FliS [Magnetococcales bacterium]NGZ28096.1 flagellar export chaperone FliS [Magnetococcales bacterium]